MKVLDRGTQKSNGYQGENYGATAATRNRVSWAQTSESDFGRPSVTPDRRRETTGSHSAPSSDNDLDKFRDRVMNGRVKLCRDCGGIMKKSSRAVLSIPFGIGLLGLGIILMGFYGYATNFLEVPWFVKFALPAVYYIGSIFIAFGVLFLFIRERIWKCGRCAEMSSRR